MDKEKDFSFDSVGKRMPYRMPENLMTDIQAAVLAEVAEVAGDSKRRAAAGRSPLRIAFRAAVSVAAAAVLFLVCYNTMRPAAVSRYSDVERAFDNLSYDDQAFLIDDYTNDAFAYVSDAQDY